MVYILVRMNAQLDGMLRSLQFMPIPQKKKRLVCTQLTLTDLESCSRKALIEQSRMNTTQQFWLV